MEYSKILKERQPLAIGMSAFPPDMGELVGLASGNPFFDKLASGNPSINTRM